VRGEVWIVDLGYQGKIRPCVVISQEPEDIDRDLRTVAPFTTQPRRSRFEVPLDVPALSREKSVVDAQNLMTTTSSKFLRKVGRLSGVQLDEVCAAARAWLEL